MKLFTVTYYKLKMMLSDRLFFAAMIILPLFITVATGFALRHEKLDIIPVAFADEDGSGYSAILLERLAGKEGLQIQAVSRIKAMEMLKANKVEAVFIIKKGFEENIRKGENKQIIDMIKAPSSFSAAFISEVVAGEVIRFSSGQLAADWVLRQYGKLKKTVDENLEDEVIRHVDSQWEPKPLMTVNYMEMEGTGAVPVDRVSMPASTATSAGIIVVFVMFYVLFSSGWLIEERRNGTLKRLVAGPGALGLAFAGNIAALAVSGGFQLLLFSLVNRLIFGVELFPGIWSYAVFGAYLLSVIAISLFLSSLLKTPAQLQAGAPVFALLTGFAGGCFWNFVEVSEEARRISMFTPQGWALEGINRLLVSPGDGGMVVMPLVVLLIIPLILIPISYIIIRRTLN